MPPTAPVGATDSATGRGGSPEPARVAIERRCPNCGTAAPDAYCGRCGQSQRDRLRTSLRELAREGFEELLDVDSKLVVTVRRLLGRPGVLTTEYLAGRRARYIRPLRLYLTASVLFFVVESLADDGGFLRREQRAAGRGGDGPRVGVTVGDREVASTTIGRRAGDVPASRPTAEPAPEGFLARRSARWRTLGPAERDRVIVEGVERHMPKAFFALVPLLALLLRALYRRAGLHYAEHVIFALHFQAFAFVAFTVAELADLATASEAAETTIMALLLAWFLGYLFVALRRVYGQSRARTAAKLTLLVPAYGVVFIAAITVVFALAVLLV